MIFVRPATLDDVREYAGKEALPDWCTRVEGHAAIRDGRVIALGLVCHDAQGGVTGWFDAKEKLSAFTMHRTAKATLADLRQRGVARIGIFCDAGKVGAAMWLERLGFKPGEWTENGQVWRCDLST